MNGAVECEHCSKGRTSRPFTGYNHRKWFKSVSVVLEGGTLRWTSTAEVVSDIAVARGSVFGLAKGDLEDRGDVVDPMFQSEGGELQAVGEGNIMIHCGAVVVEDKLRQAVDVAGTSKK
jgi:hypothetical protein